MVDWVPMLMLFEKRVLARRVDAESVETLQVDAESVLPRSVEYVPLETHRRVLLVVLPVRVLTESEDAKSVDAESVMNPPLVTERPVPIKEDAVRLDTSIMELIPPFSVEKATLPRFAVPAFRVSMVRKEAVPPSKEPPLGR